MKFQPKCLGYVHMNIPLTRWFEVNLACLRLISPWGQQEESKSTIVVRSGGLRFRTIHICEVKNDARDNCSGGIQSHASKGAGGGCLATSPAGKRQAHGGQPDEVPTARQ
jgi:hypothetical protein